MVPVADETSTTKVRRRGLIAGAAALAVGMAAGATDRVAAGSGDPVLLGRNSQSAYTDTTLISNPGTTLNPLMFEVANYPSTIPTPPANSRISIYGVTTNVGGVTGPGDTTASPVGICGNAQGRTGTTGVGVLGISNGYGVVGTTTGQSIGLYGLATVDGSVAFAGGTNNNNAYAALLTGRVVVTGALQVTGAKSAALPHPDGSYRLVYCVEAPESWLEDFGEGKIVAGRAEVKLDPDFAAVIDPTEVHVFPASHDGDYQLGVTQRSGQGFTVEVGAAAVGALGKRMTDVNGTFSYRVVAKRKDIPANRLAKVDIPKLKLENPIGPFVVGKDGKK